MTEGQQRVVLLGAIGTLVVLLACYILFVLFRVLWTRWQLYLSAWARRRVEHDRNAAMEASGKTRHHHHRTDRKHRRRDSDSDSRSYSSDDDSRSY